MSDYIGGGVTLLVIAAAIASVLYFSGERSGGEGSIISEAVAAMPVEADYGWKVVSPAYDAGDDVFEYN
jgi:hypothetical protein